MASVLPLICTKKKRKSGGIHVNKKQIENNDQVHATKHKFSNRKESEK
jgi:hypothetical protein